MNPKIFISFLIITVIVVIAAGFSIATRYSVHKIGFEDKPVFPGFAKKAQKVDLIKVKYAQKEISVKRQGNSWQLVERQNYLASNKVINDLMLGLSELRLREEKTKKARLYPRLQVEDPNNNEAKSMLLTIMAGNSELAEVIVGKVSNDVAGPANIGRYIRLPGQDQSWLASGRLDIPKGVSKWVRPEFLDISSARVIKVEVLHPNGESMIVSRTGKKKFQIDNMPAKMVVEYQSDIDNMGDGLDKLELEDVMASNMVQFPKDKTIITTIRTKDGMIVKVKLIDINDGNFWGYFVATANTDAKDAIKKEAAYINNRVAKWVYQIPAHKYRYMSRKHSDVLKLPGKNKKK